MTRDLSFCLAMTEKSGERERERGAAERRGTAEGGQKKGFGFMELGNY